MSTVFHGSNILRMFQDGEHVMVKSATDLIRQAGLLEVNPEEPLVIFDNACGTGVITKRLHQMLDNRVKQNMHILCGDISPTMIDGVKDTIDRHGWSHVDAKVVDGMKTGLPSNTFTHVLTGHGLLSMPDQDAALNEIYRILRPGGVCSLSNWTVLGWLPHIRAAIATIPGCPLVPDQDEFLTTVQNGRTFHHTDYARQNLVELGFSNVVVEIVESPSTVPDAEVIVEMFDRVLSKLFVKFWTPLQLDEFLPKIGPAVRVHISQNYKGVEVPFGMRALITTGFKNVSKNKI